MRETMVTAGHIKKKIRESSRKAAESGINLAALIIGVCDRFAWPK